MLWLLCQLFHRVSSVAGAPIATHAPTATAGAVSASAMLSTSPFLSCVCLFACLSMSRGELRQVAALLPRRRGAAISGQWRFAS